MSIENEILNKLQNIEATIEEIYKVIINLKKENEDKNLEQMQIMLRIENLADFIKTRYNVVIEEKEKFLSRSDGKC